MEMDFLQLYFYGHQSLTLGDNKRILLETNKYVIDYV